MLEDSADRLGGADQCAASRRVKSFFGENKKDKKGERRCLAYLGPHEPNQLTRFVQPSAVKTPTEEKAEPLLATDAPVAAPAEGETAPAPAETAAVPAVTAPETVAAAQATANNTAPVPQVIEPIPEPINEPSTAAEISTSAAEPETAATAAAGTEVKPEGEGAVKVEEQVSACGSTFDIDPICPPMTDHAKPFPQAKADEKAPKRDLAKLSRRLSGELSCPSPSLPSAQGN